MPSLSRELRKDLENVTKDARETAERAARAALENLAVHERQARGHMDEPKRKLRAALRARGKALGDARASDGSQELTRLLEHTAYEHWHRLLFTRYLTENHLLLMPDDAGGAPTPVTVEECDELAPELGARDGFDLACRFAGKTLPGVFRADDPVLDLAFAPEGQVALRKLLDGLPSAVFTADDSLGWTYQFWQAQRKEEVNKSGKKIGAAELSPVTQLFTEDYMVEFLLHNTLGAWWAGRCATLSNFKSALSNSSTEVEARAAVALPSKNGAPAIDWTYLRFVQDDATKAWVPAAGTFPGWPRTARALTMLDPSMGSGHFLVFALPLLVRLRIEEENLSAAAAVAAVLRDNLHGLELDERCTQIAAFNLALAAWKLAGYQPLPALHLACSGLAPHTTQAEWVALAGDDARLRYGMLQLFKLFDQAPMLGSLINPRAVAGAGFSFDFQELTPLLARAVRAEATADDTAREMAVTARGLAKAAELLAGQFTLVATNVPYLGRGKQEGVLQTYCDTMHTEAKADLATCFVERCISFCINQSGSAVLVTPQNWLFSSTYRKFRIKLLETATWNIVTRLGTKGFQTPMWDFNTALLAITNTKPLSINHFSGLDVAELKSADEKACALITSPTHTISQKEQLGNTDSIISIEQLQRGETLSDYADSVEGLSTGDKERYLFCFWELHSVISTWEPFQLSPNGDSTYECLTLIIRWENGIGELTKSEGARVQGHAAWGRRCVLVGQIKSDVASLTLGFKHDKMAVALRPKIESDLSAIWCFCSTPQFNYELRKLTQRLNAATGTIAKVPFDIRYWRDIAAEKYPKGLPKPTSSDPTQWLFNGNPKGSDQPLHVALARLLGYRWPRQTGSSFPDCPALDPDGLETFADADGIVCLPPINREAPAAARLRHLLAAALGTYEERALIAAAGPKGSDATTLETWLRDEAFAQHCSLFQDCPFVWHLWDGLKDGFHVLVNYHRLDHATLEKVTFSYLGEWIRQQADDAKADKPGAAARLGAAQALQEKLKAILTGEAPLDIFVRWKPLSDQAIGWHPDLNDGIRQNIRPFLYAGDVAKKGAGLFRTVPLKLKESDRGTEPDRPRADYPWFWCEEDPGTDPKGGKDPVGTRWNTTHLTLEYKKEARS